MSIFDRPVHGPFDRMFDFNHDGKIDPGEDAVEFEYLKEMEEEEERRKREERIAYINVLLDRDIEDDEDLDD